MKPSPLLFACLMMSSLLTSGCLPSIQRLWDVQPVDGTLVDGHSGEPIAGAVITNLDTPQLSATSDDNGYFAIEGQSHVGLHLMMAASAMATQSWRIQHPDYPDGYIATRTLIPPLSRQPSHLTLALFASYPDSPADCPAFGYLIRLAEWHKQQGIDSEWVETGECRNRAAQEALYDAWYPR